MKCIVPICSSESSRSARSEGITFHKFPTDKDALAAWQKSLGLTSYNPFEDSVICSEHFHESDFCVTNYGLRKLHHDAVPVNLDPELLVAAKVCRVCFVMDSKMKDLQRYCKSFEDVTGIPCEDGDSRLPQHICWQCAAQLRTAANFRAKALLSDGLLHDLLNRKTDLKFCALKPMRRVLKEYGFESKLKQETFDIEHFDTYISDSSVDTKPKHNDHNYTDNDLHEIIDESVMKNDANDDIIDENVTETNDSGDDIKCNTFEIEEHDEIEFLDTNEYTMSNTGIEMNLDSKRFIHNTVNNTEINSDSKNVINVTINNKNLDGNAKYYIGIDPFENNDASHDTSAYKPELFKKRQFQPATANYKYANNIVQRSDGEDSVPFKNINEGRQYPTIDISQFQPVQKSKSNRSDHVEKTVPSKKLKVKKAPNIDFRYARNLLKRLGHVKDPPRAKKSKNTVTETNPNIKRGQMKSDGVVESYSIKNGDITVHYMRDITDCEIPAEVSQLKSHFTITKLTQDQSLQEIESRKEQMAYTLNPYKCGECYQSFLHEERYNLHMIKHDKRFGLHQCGICKIFKKQKKHLRLHMKNAHSFEFACNKCSWNSRNRTTARAHIKFHEGRTFACPHCPKTFGCRTSYFSHIRLNHICDVVCDICGYAFVSSAGLNFHKNRVHKLLILNLPPFEGPHCDTCDIKFLSQEAYDTHLKCSSKHLQSEDDPARIRNESGQRLYHKHVRKTQGHRSHTTTCELCGEQCVSVRAYREHFLKSHRGIAPTQKRYLLDRLQQPVMCDQCGKNFQTNYLLRTHQWQHTGRKLFECDVCKKAFTLKSTLIRHIEIAHMNVERNTYTCEHCGKIYTEKANLHRHNKKVHAIDKRFKCLQCDRTYVYQSELNAHVEYFHNKKPYPKRKNPRKKPVKSGQ